MLINKPTLLPLLPVPGYEEELFLAGGSCSSTISFASKDSVAQRCLLTRVRLMAEGKWSNGRALIRPQKRGQMVSVCKAQRAERVQGKGKRKELGPNNKGHNHKKAQGPFSAVLGQGVTTL